MTNRVPFQSIDTTDTDEVGDTVRQFAAERGINRIAPVKPSSEPVEALPPSGATDLPETPRAPSAAKFKRTAANAKQSQLSLKLPLYVHEQLEARRNTQADKNGRRPSKQYLVMKALRSVGIHIADEDMSFDGRSERGKK